MCGDFSDLSETALLWRSSTSCIVLLPLVGHFLLCAKNACVHATPSRRCEKAWPCGAVYAVHNEGLHFRAFNFGD